MNTHLHRASAGRPFRPSASAWNAFLEGEALDGRARVNRASAGSPGNWGLPCNVASIKNSTASDVVEGSILTPSAGLATFPLKPSEARRAPMLTGIAPTHARDLVFVTLEPIKAGSIGLAAVSGLTACTVNITDADHLCAKAVAGSVTALVSSKGGPVRIAARESSGTGLKLCFVILGIVPWKIEEHVTDVDCVDGELQVTYDDLLEPDYTE